jgi:hypothetical protein
MMLGRILSCWLDTDIRTVFPTHRIAPRLHACELPLVRQTKKPSPRSRRDLESRTLFIASAWKISLYVQEVMEQMTLPCGKVKDWYRNITVYLSWLTFVRLKAWGNLTFPCISLLATVLRISVVLRCMQGQLYQRVYTDEINIRINNIHVG